MGAPARQEALTKASTHVAWLRDAISTKASVALTKGQQLVADSGHANKVEGASAKLSSVADTAANVSKRAAFAWSAAAAAWAAGTNADGQAPSAPGDKTS